MRVDERERKRKNARVDLLTIKKKNEERRGKSNTAQKYTKENSSRGNNSK